jgi:hypothetical protein
VHLPTPRGPLSDAILDLVQLDPTDPAADSALERAMDAAAGVTAEHEAALHDDDLQLALFMLYELHYSGLDDTNPDWEWDHRLLAVRAGLERVFETALRGIVETPPLPQQDAASVAAALFQLTAPTAGPSLSREVARHATREQAAEYLMLRSIYQLKEADPHTWAIPRLRGRAKAALVEVQSDEYGGGHADRVHQELFARAMRSLGLDDS